MSTQENKTENQKNKIIIFLKKHWVLLTICIITLITIVFYFGNFWGTGLSDKTDDWGDFGGYFGGIIGTIFAFGAFMLMKETLEVQKKEFKNQSKIFNQEQFEQNFFNLIKLIGENQVKEKSGNEQLDYHIIYGFVKEIKKIIENYRNKLENGLTNEKDEEKKHRNKEDIKEQIDSYINILKLQIKDETHIYLLDTIKDYDDYELKIYFERNNFCEFMKIERIKNNITSYEEYFDKSIFGKNLAYQRRLSSLWNITEEEYRELYKTKDPIILRNLARNRHIIMNCLDVLEELASNENKEVRQAVASNQDTPETILYKLADDECKEVRKELAMRLYIPIKILEKLAKDEEKEVYAEIAKKHAINGLLEKILKHSNYDLDICNIAIEKEGISTNILSNILEKKGIQIISDIMSHQNSDNNIFNQAIGIIEKENNNKAVENSIRSLCKYKKLFEDKTLVKEYIYLYIHKIQFKYSSIELLFKLDNEHEKQKIVIDMIFQYLTEYPIDNTTLENICRFIHYLRQINTGKIEYFTENIQEKINQTKLTDTQKEQLLNIFMDKKTNK